MFSDSPSGDGGPLRGRRGAAEDGWGCGHVFEVKDFSVLETSFWHTVSRRNQWRGRSGFNIHLGHGDKVTALVGYLLRDLIYIYIYIYMFYILYTYTYYMTKQMFHYLCKGLHYTHCSSDQLLDQKHKNERIHHEHLMYL